MEKHLLVKIHRKNIKKKSWKTVSESNYWRYNVFITLKKSENLLFVDCELFKRRNCVSFLFVFSLLRNMSYIPVQFNSLRTTGHLVTSNSLPPHGLQHTRLPCLSQLLELAQTHVHRFGDAIQPSYPRRPLLLLTSIFPGIKVFSNESVLCIKWPKYWSFSFTISPPNEYSGLITSRIDWFDFLAVQETLKSPLQLHSSKASILWRSALWSNSHICTCMTTGKTIALTGPLLAK